MPSRKRGTSRGTRAAYQWNAQTSVYVHPDYRRGGVASALYAALFTTLKAQGFYTAYAIITHPNEASEAFHRSEGFTELGIHPASGFKLGAWADVAYMEKILRAREGTPEPVIPFALFDASRITGQSC